MKSTTKKQLLRNQGFTLVEMLVVLAILVLLVGMVAPRVLKSQKKADVNNAKAQIGMFRTCLDRYAIDMKDYPTTEQGLNALIQRPEGDSGMSGAGATEPLATTDGGMSGTTATTSAPSSGWDGPYVNQDSMPADPWGHAYQYEYPPSHGKGEYPDIWSFGPDGQDGTEDDIVSWSNTDGSSDATSSEGESTPRRAPARGKFDE
jgi:general secretion pathway protein G